MPWWQKQVYVTGLVNELHAKAGTTPDEQVDWQQPGALAAAGFTVLDE